jgi:hypothetical protein
LALSKEGLHRELEVWLSPKLPALGEDSVSGSACTTSTRIYSMGRLFVAH